MSEPCPAPTPSLWDGRALETLLPLVTIGPDRYASTASDDNFNRRLYGGQLLGQALLAAAQTVPEGRRAHMLQACFLRGAAIDQPLRFDVQRLLDGGRYSSRHVRVTQAAHAVLDAQVSFQVPSDPPQHRRTDGPDDVPGPEQLRDMVDLVRDGQHGFELRMVPLVEKHCVEMRPVDPERFVFQADASARQRFWLKLRDGLPETPALHDAALAYLSDFLVTYCSYSPYTSMVDMRDFYVASLNHGLWFHENLRCDDWLLFDCQSPATGHGRGFAVVQIYDRQRRLVATATQQCTLGERR